ncbi:uncharacterized protein LOC122276843 [Carya illinoinensis]|uniref:uncharacterized protein LOC122276843 n=1 Tax=Carya illinoinensis TaxID=32201 RepID=UPI001C71954D|nr:uncharacterized protein LOC122276843 [Carya illinoinensis]
MKISYLYWNARGVGTSRKRLKKLVSKLHPKLLAIAEPMDLNLVVDSMGDQFLTVHINSLNDLCITFVYAKCSYLEHRRLWGSLMDANTHNLPWMVLGDFNIIINDLERRGGRPPLTLAMEEFNGWVDSCGILDMPFRGNSLSWCNGHLGNSRHWARLDRFFLNIAALAVFPDANMEYLARTSSDHAPMAVSLENQLVRAWNKQIFSRTETHIAELEDRIKGLEVRLPSDYSNEVEDDLVATQLDLSAWLDKEEQRLAQIAK